MAEHTLCFLHAVQTWPLGDSPGWLLTRGVSPAQLVSMQLVSIKLTQDHQRPDLIMISSIRTEGLKSVV